MIPTLNVKDKYKIKKKRVKKTSTTENDGQYFKIVKSFLTENNTFCSYDECKVLICI